MRFKRFAVGAALLAALVPCSGRADRLQLLFDQNGVIISSRPSNFISGGGSAPFNNITGDAVWSVGSATGIYGFVSLSVTMFPQATEAFSSNIDVSNNQLGGIPVWTAVEDYPTLPELIGTLTVTMSSGSPAFTADFPLGSTLPIDLTMAAPDSPAGMGFQNCRVYEQSHTVPPGSICLQVIGGEILAAAPEPATLSILGAALAIFLMARRSVRRPAEGPAHDILMS